MLLNHPSLLSISIQLARSSSPRRRSLLRMQLLLHKPPSKIKVNRKTPVKVANKVVKITKEERHQLVKKEHIS